MENKDLKSRLRKLFYGKNAGSILFNRFLLALNTFAVFLFLLEPLFPTPAHIRAMELFFGFLFLGEYGARMWTALRKWRFLIQFVNLLDLIVIFSLFAPVLFGHLGYLRIIRSLRILRTYRLIVALKGEKSWFAKNEAVIMSTVNLFVFIFIMTDIVYYFQFGINPHINDYVDALYFTLATLTTTGFGDITLQGRTGKFLSIFIMVFGITLFVKLARDIVRPAKVHFTCSDCGLNMHDHDAVHCKHCGKLIKIITDGE